MKKQCNRTLKAKISGDNASVLFFQPNSNGKITQYSKLKLYFASDNTSVLFIHTNARIMQLK